MIASGVAVFEAWVKAFAVDKLAKSDVDYRDRPKGRERCDNCRVWVPPDSCKSAEGRISPSGWCDIWRPSVVQNAIVPDPEERLRKDDVAYQNTPKGRQRCAPRRAAILAGRKLRSQRHALANLRTAHAVERH